MLDTQSRLEPDDIAAVAALHRATLPLSVLGRMGDDILVRYYQWVIGSPEEWLVVSRGEAGIQGAAVVSFAPESLLRRFASHAAAAFLQAVAGCLLRDRAFRGEAAAYAREWLTPGREAPASPEIMQIFVGGAQQNQSVGSALLERVQAFLRQRNVASYYARTLVVDNAKTLGFYERRGFTPVRHLQFCGAAYVLLKKSVPGEQRE